MKWWHYLLISIGVGILLGMPLFLDPYYHQEKVTLPVWVYRELDELRNGEKA